MDIHTPSYSFPPLKRCWRKIVALSLILASFPTMVTAGKKYLYSTLENGDGDPILEYSDQAENPAFIYEPDYPHHRVVEFYSPNCPHCVHFAPHYIEFARHFNQLTQPTTHGNNATTTATATKLSKPASNHYAGMKVEFHAVSCLAHPEICKTQKIRAYPSIKIFPKGTLNATQIRVTELHAMSLVKTLGVSVVDDFWQEEEEQEDINEESGVSSSQAVERPEDQKSNAALLARSPQEIFSDAYLSFHTAMKTSVFVEEGGGDAIPKQRQYVLQNWLDLMQKSLPPWRIHDLLGALLGGTAGVRNTAFVANIKTEASWNAILEQFPPRQTEWSRACRQQESPYTCGLWTLFHIMSVGVVEFNGDIVNKDHNRFHVFNNQVVSKMLKDYVQHFLLCEACTAHFVEEYDACSYDRCKRLSDKHAGKLEDWKELPLWLLETHNGVNVRLQQDRFQEAHQEDQSAQILPTIEQQQSVMWPAVQECPTCWLETNGTASLKKYNHTMTYNYLRLVYWPFDEKSLVTREDIIRIQSGLSAPGGEKMLVMTEEMQYSLVAVVVLTLGVVVWSKRRRLFGSKTRTR